MARPKKTAATPASAAKKPRAVAHQTPVLKKAQPGSAVTLILSPDNDGVTASSLIDSLRNLHPEAPVVFSSKTFAQRMEEDRDFAVAGKEERRKDQDAANRAMSDALSSTRAEPKPISRVEELFARIERNMSSLHAAISTHEALIRPCLSLPRDEEGAELMQAEGTGSGQLVTELEHHNAVLSSAILRIEALTARVQL